MENASKFIDLRISLGLLQEELANEIGISRQAISNYERGYNVPTKIKRIVNAKFGVNLNWWEDDNEPMFVEKSDEIGKNQPQNFVPTAQNGGTVDTLVAMLAAKDKQMIAKDEQLASLISQLGEKDKQLAEKDNMINKLLEMIETQKSSPAHTVAKTA